MRWAAAAALSWPVGLGLLSFGQAGGQDAVVDGGEEFRGVQAVVGDLVAVGAGDAGDQAAVFESA